MTFFKVKKSLLAAIILTLCLMIGLAVWIFADEPVSYKKITTGYISPSDISIDGNSAYVSDATSNKIYKLNLQDNSVQAEFSASQQVNSIYAQGDTVYFLEGGLAGNIVKTNSSLSSAEITAETGHTPVDMVIHNGKIYVACRYSNEICVYNQSDLSEVKVIEISREPMALTVAGKYVYAASHLPDGAANADTVSAKVTVIDTETDSVAKEIPLLNGSGGVKGICTSPDGNYVYVANIIARYAYPTTQLDRGWINTNAVTIIDTQSQEIYTAVLLDNVEEGAANPWGIECSGDDLIVSLSGTSEVMVIDTKLMFREIDIVKDGRNKNVATISDIPNYMPFMDDCKVRIYVGGQGLRNLAIKDGTAYICRYFTGDISVFDIEDKKETSSISLGEQPEADAVRTGETLWFDATMCYQKWESCASCHPDARVDGFNWDNLNDSLGNPKSAKSMIYSHRTPPVMITGIRDSAETAVRSGMKYIQFNVLDEEGLNAIDEYLKSISPIQSPYLNRDGSLTEAALEGKEIFEDAGCVKCHYGPNFTDMLRHKSNSYSDTWDNREFDTPTLVEVWSSGPWFASGQFATLKEAVAASLPDDYKISDEKLDKLTSYVGSIGNQGEYYGAEQVKIRSSDGKDVYNALYADSEIYEMSVRKQLPTDKNAVVTITLYGDDDKEITSKSITLESMDVGDTAIIPLGIKTGAELKVGAYYVVSIKAEDGSSLATDFTVYNNG